jgi:glutamate-1-semialdehyde 2,1-aminomutase
MTEAAGVRGRTVAPIDRARLTGLLRRDRAEYRFQAEPPRTGAEAGTAIDAELEQYMHVFALNRGALLTPFHNIALMSPATTLADVYAHGEIFEEAVTDLLG